MPLECAVLESSTVESSSEPLFEETDRRRSAWELELRVAAGTPSAVVLVERRESRTVDVVGIGIDAAEDAASEKRHR